MRVSRSARSASHPVIGPKNPARRVIAKGLPASPGAATGAVVFDADMAVRRARKVRSSWSVKRPIRTTSMEWIREGDLTASWRDDVSRGGRCRAHGEILCGGLRKEYPRQIEEAKQFNCPRGRSSKENDWVTIRRIDRRVTWAKVALIDPKFQENSARSWVGRTTSGS